MKKAFTLVEFLFLMAIVSILAGFAIAHLKDSRKVEFENSIKIDAKNAIEKQFNFFSKNQKYDSIEGSFKDSENENGVLISKNGTKFKISEGNSLKTEETDCGDGTVGFIIDTRNENLVDTSLHYNSCFDDYNFKEGETK